MRRTIYLPDEFAARVDEYLKVNRNLTFSSLAREAIEQRIAPKDPSAILKLIGLASKDTPRRYVPPEERQPDDRVIDRER